MKRRWYEATPRRYDRTLRAECGCPVAGPDRDGRYDLIEREDCPVHGTGREGG